MNATLRGPSSCAPLSPRRLNRALSTLTLSTPSPRPWTCAACCSRLPRHTIPPPTTTPASTIRLRPAAAAAASSSRSASSSPSSSQWKSRQSRDRFARDAKVQGLKSRAAFKLLELDAKYRLFRRHQAVVDLGFAPGSWSQVAVERTRPHGVVVGIDLIPAMPPRGVTSIQGDFLSPHVRRLVREVVVEQVRRRARERAIETRFEGALWGKAGEGPDGAAPAGDREGDVLQDRPSYIDLEKDAAREIDAAEADNGGRMVDVVISDMSEPWPQTAGFMSNTLSNPYRRLMNTSGISFRDHAGSMDLCYAALAFASDNLKPSGHFVCKFYQGAEDKLLQTKLQKMFEKVHREKPDSSRKDSKESFLVGLRRKAGVTLASIEGSVPQPVQS